MPRLYVAWCDRRALTTTAALTEAPFKGVAIGLNLGIRLTLARTCILPALDSWALRRWALVSCDPASEIEGFRWVVPPAIAVLTVVRHQWPSSSPAASARARHRTGAKHT